MSTEEKKRTVTFQPGYPGSCSGNLLAWLGHAMGGEEQLAQIACVEVLECPPHLSLLNGVSDDDMIRAVYRFDPVDFDVEFSAPYGHITAIEKLSRFVMHDGSAWLIETCDGEYHQTGLIYVAPITTPPVLKTGLGVLMGCK